MNPFVRAVSIGVVAVLLLDTFGSLAARQLHFRYSSLAPISYGLWCATGALAAGTAGTIAAYAILIGAGAAASVGFIDATLGWWIAWQVGPGRVPVERMTRLRLVRITGLVVWRAASYGAIGAAGAVLLGAHQTWR